MICPRSPSYNMKVHKKLKLCFDFPQTSQCSLHQNSQSSVLWEHLVQITAPCQQHLDPIPFF